MIKSAISNIHDKRIELIVCKRDNINPFSFWNYIKRRCDIIKADTNNLFYSKNLKKHVLLICKSVEEDGFVEELKKIR